MAVVVASVPSGHVYVRHLAAESGEDPVLRLPDPDPGAPHRPAGARWWPPVMLDPGWAARADFDVFHLHFGFDACAPEQLRSLVEVLRRRGKPLVFTVHDLRNPHHAGREQHDAQLNVLVPAADELITLTPGAADLVARRWGRQPQVQPHPHVVELPAAARLRARRCGGTSFRVGLHVKSLRSSMDPLRLLPTLIETVRDLPGAVLQVNGHRDVLAPDGSRRHEPLARYLQAAAERGDVDLRVHDYLADAQLWDYLASLDLSVLPYRFGTHSGWLEACRDLGTTVVAPTCGFYAEQGPVLSYVHDEDGFSPESLADAVRTAYRLRPDYSCPLPYRRAQRARLAAVHAGLYAALLDDRST